MKSQLAAGQLSFAWGKQVARLCPEGQKSTAGWLQFINFVKSIDKHVELNNPDQKSKIRCDEI